MSEFVTIHGVIVADDDPVVRGILSIELQRIGQAVFLASNGAEAVKLAQRVHPALILLDLRMPVMNGLIACQMIRRMPDTHHTPIVILTGTVATDLEMAALRAGASAFLTKPFQSAALLHSLAAFLTITESVRCEIERDAARAGAIAHGGADRARIAVEETVCEPLLRGRAILAALRE